MKVSFIIESKCHVSSRVVLFLTTVNSSFQSLGNCRLGTRPYPQAR